MRKIVAGLFMSLDGVVESPDKWSSPYFNEEIGEAIATGIKYADAVLLGRRTYQEFAKIWPNQGSDMLMADFLNNTPKYVVSATLDKLEWGPAHQIKGNLADELRKLKQQPGKNIQVPGSPTLVRSLLREGLLDELSLSICPIVVGAGMRLFDGTIDQMSLKLVHSQSTSTGVLGARYEPMNAGHPKPVDQPISRPSKSFPPGPSHSR